MLLEDPDYYNEPTKELVAKLTRQIASLTSQLEETLEECQLLVGEEQNARERLAAFVSQHTDAMNQKYDKAKAQLEEKERQLGQRCEAGTPEAIIEAMFELAQRYGHSAVSSQPPLVFIAEQLTLMRRALEQIKQAVSPGCVAVGSPEHFFACRLLGIVEAALAASQEGEGE